MGVLGDIYQGVQAKKSADIEAKQLRERAAARRAESGAASREERRQGRLKQSRAQALAAASGASLADPTIINLMGDLEGEGEYRALARLYEGEQEARGFDNAARNRKREGKAKMIGHALNAADRLAGKYG